jgi:pimeloyl-ACP methyl ester carboxylesterase
MERAENRVTLSTGDLWYHVRGTGRPVVHLHPAAGVCPTPVVDALARSFKVYLPVAPGFDGTPLHPGVASMQALAALTGEFIDAVIGENCDVVGYSFGGNQAAWLALTRPERIEHLVLEAPYIVLPGDVAAAGRVENTHFPALAHYARADADLVEQLGAYDRPTLILQGTLDPIVPAVSVQRLRRQLRSAFLVYVWDAAHPLETEQPERVHALIDGFLTRSEAFIVNWGTLAVNRP